MNCPACGAPNQPNAAFCSQCATNLLVPGGVVPPMPYQAAAASAPRTSGMAITGFVLSFFCGVLGLIFSSIGYSECKKSGGTIGGEGLALAGIIISIVTTLIALLYIIAIVFVTSAVRHH